MKTATSATTWTIGNLAWSAPNRDPGRRGARGGAVRARRRRPCGAPRSRFDSSASGTARPAGRPPAPRGPRTRPCGGARRRLSRESAPAEHDRDDEDPAVDDLQVGGVDRERGQEVLQQVDGERAEQRADQPAAPAGQRGAAEHDGRDREQGVLGGARRVGRVHQAGQGQAAEAGEQAAERVARHPHRVDVDAAREGRRVVAADRVEQAPERDEPQAEPDEQRHADRDHAAGYRPDRPGEMLDPSGCRCIETGFGRDEQVDALEDEVHRERDDDRLDAQRDDEQAVQRRRPRARRRA